MPRDVKQDPREGDTWGAPGDIQWIFTNGDWRVLLEDIELEDDIFAEFQEADLPVGIIKNNLVRTCSKCNSTNVRKTLSGFQTVTEIWWCDDCKDEA